MRPQEPTITIYEKLLRIYSSDNCDPNQYVILFEGQERIITRLADESSAMLWVRVCKKVDDMRLAIYSGSLSGRQYAFAHIYAGVMPNEVDRIERMREWIEFRLWNLSNPIINSDHKARVHALCTLADIYGLNAIKVVQSSVVKTALSGQFYLPDKGRNV